MKLLKAKKNNTQIYFGNQKEMDSYIKDGWSIYQGEELIYSPEKGLLKDPEFNEGQGMETNPELLEAFRAFLLEKEGLDG